MSTTENAPKEVKKETKKEETIIVSKKSDSIPAIEKAPDQSVLNKPKPRLGESLVKSWTHAKSKK